MSEETKSSREFLGSRLGFILLSAGCAIGLGNIWRFPYITGQYGGALFVCFYLLFLIMLGFPAMVMELAIGRASRQCLVGCFRTLKPAESRIPWVGFGKLFFAGNLILLMFYSVITGWLLSYTYDYLTGVFNYLKADDIG
ncbi:MAG: sodium-dependent transporter, partial [Victivallales bacterium]|nr:sodium-dependent transporter [Victivallales bacterium]